MRLVRLTARASLAAAARPAALAVLATFAPASASAQVAPRLPFGPGETLVYRITSSRFGNVGEGCMGVGGPESVRGREAYVLHFDFEARVAFFTVEDRTRSWIDPRGLASLRYHKRERNPLTSRNEEVEIHPEELRWIDTTTGRDGRSPTNAPLDELSFIYFLRTLPLADGEMNEHVRHFDPERNPVVVRVLGRERLRAPIGDFQTVVVEMKVRDAGRFGGQGTLRLHLTDDAQRLPIRIETSVPLAGTLVLDLVQAILPDVASPVDRHGVGYSTTHPSADTAQNFLRIPTADDDPAEYRGHRR